MNAYLDYLGPADSVTLEREAGLSLPPADAGDVIRSLERVVPEGSTVATIILQGLPEARLHVLARLYPMLAHLPLPEIPASKMDALEALLRAALAAAADGRAGLDDLDDLLDALKAIRDIQKR